MTNRYWKICEDSKFSNFKKTQYTDINTGETKEVLNFVVRWANSGFINVKLFKQEKMDEIVQGKYLIPIDWYPHQNSFVGRNGNTIKTFEMILTDFEVVDLPPDWKRREKAEQEHKEKIENITPEQVQEIKDIANAKDASEMTDEEFEKELWG